MQQFAANLFSLASIFAIKRYSPSFSAQVYLQQNTRPRINSGY
jgi:hypothetical protein